MIQPKWTQKVLDPDVGLDLCEVFSRLSEDFPNVLEHRCIGNSDSMPLPLDQREMIRQCVPAEVIERVQSSLNLDAAAAEEALHQLIVGVFDLTSGDGHFPSTLQVKLTANLIRRNKLTKAIPDPYQAEVV